MWNKYIPNTVKIAVLASLVVAGANAFAASYKDPLAHKKKLDNIIAESRSVYFLDKGRSSIELKREDNAERYFTEAIRLDGSNSTAYAYRGILNLKKGDCLAAITDIKEALDLDEFGDKYVPWTISKEKKIYNRFYHFFSKREVKKILRIFKIKEFSMRGGSTNKDNFFILAKKK